MLPSDGSGIVRSMGDRPHFRRSRRQPVSIRVRFRRDAPGASLEREGTLIDLSVQGAFVGTTHPMAKGSQVRMVFSSPTAWEPLEVGATVRWLSDGTGSDPVGFGVRFESLSPHEATALYELVHASAYAESPE